MRAVGLLGRCDLGPESLNGEDVRAHTERLAPAERDLSREAVARADHPVRLAHGAEEVELELALLRRRDDDVHETHTDPIQGQFALRRAPNRYRPSREGDRLFAPRSSDHKASEWRIEVQRWLGTPLQWDAAARWPVEGA